MTTDRMASAVSGLHVYLLEFLPYNAPLGVVRVRTDDNPETSDFKS